MRHGITLLCLVGLNLDWDCLVPHCIMDSRDQWDFPQFSDPNDGPHAPLYSRQCLPLGLCNGTVIGSSIPYSQWYALIKSWHSPSFAHGALAQSSMFTSQRSPVHPATQLHSKLLIPSTHVALFRQGNTAQSSMFVYNNQWCKYWFPHSLDWDKRAVCADGIFKCVFVKESISRKFCSYVSN